MILNPEGHLSLEVKHEMLPVQLPFQLTQQQLEIYKTGREFIKSLPVQRFNNRIKDCIRTNGVTLLYVTGESKSGKEMDCGQTLAEILFDSELQQDVYTHGKPKGVRGHYWSLGVAVEKARSRGKVISDHPDYNKNEIEWGKFYLKDMTHQALARLPYLDPESAHFGVIEVPAYFAMGSIVVTPQTFVKARIGNPTAQSEAAPIRNKYGWENKAIQLAKIFPGQIVIDAPEMVVGDVYWNCGDEASAIRGINIMNSLMAEASRQSKMPKSIPPFTEKDLEQQPDFRRGVVLPTFYQVMLRDLGVTNSQWIVDRGEYIQGSKHYLPQLIYKLALDWKQLEKYGK